MSDNPLPTNNLGYAAEWAERELTRLRAQQTVLVGALKSVPRWEATPRGLVCTNCRFQSPEHDIYCWVDRVEQALATLDVEEKM